MEDINKKILDATIGTDISLYNQLINEEDKENIEEFIDIYASKFKINWNRDNSFKIKVKHKKGKQIFTIDFSSKHAAKVDPDQMVLGFVDTATGAEAEDPELVGEES